jgi:alpha-L-arabinofuranosidase
MESGEVIALDPLNAEACIAKIDRMLDMVNNDRNKIKRVGVKVDLWNGDWIKTDGKSITSRNVTDSTFIEFLSKAIKALESFYVEGMNGKGDKNASFNKMVLDMAHLQEEYDY